MIEAVHEAASGLHRFGFIDRRKMDGLDALCIEREAVLQQAVATCGNPTADGRP